MRITVKGSEIRIGDRETIVLSAPNFFNSSKSDFKKSFKGRVGVEDLEKAWKEIQKLKPKKSGYNKPVGESAKD